MFSTTFSKYLKQTPILRIWFGTATVLIWDVLTNHIYVNEMRSCVHSYNPVIWWLVCMNAITSWWTVMKWLCQRWQRKCNNNHNNFRSLFLDWDITEWNVSGFLLAWVNTTGKMGHTNCSPFLRTQIHSCFSGIRLAQSFDFVVFCGLVCLFVFFSIFT